MQGTSPLNLKLLLRHLAPSTATERCGIILIPNILQVHKFLSLKIVNPFFSVSWNFLPICLIKVFFKSRNIIFKIWEIFLCYFPSFCLVCLLSFSFIYFPWDASTLPSSYFTDFSIFLVEVYIFFLIFKSCFFNSSEYFFTVFHGYNILPYLPKELLLILVVNFLLFSTLFLFPLGFFLLMACWGAYFSY